MNDPCKPCEGCVLYEEMGRSNGIACLALNYFKLNGIKNTCPCGNCVVKPMCLNACKERTDFGEGKKGYFGGGRTIVKFGEAQNVKCV